jgi:hypothetical protein
MKLENEQIQFIDQYLTKSEVVFDDLRMELIDHVASAVSHKMVEENIAFYDAFKNYMVENKKSVLKAGMVTRTFNFSLAISKFGRFVTTREVLSFSVIFIFLGLKPLKLLLLQHLQTFQTIVVSSVVMFVIIWVIIFAGIFRKRIFVLENNTILLAFIIQILHISRGFYDENSTTAFYVTFFSSLFVVLFIAFMLKTSFNFYSKNKNFYAVD